MGKNGKFERYFRALAKGVREKEKPEKSEGIPGPAEALNSPRDAMPGVGNIKSHRQDYLSKGV